jgi:heme-degrading monooxygenase HmoA
MMQAAHGMLAEAEGLTFYKLMGSGKGNGFNPWPDWSTYAVLTTWQDEAAARAWTASPLYRRYADKTGQIATLYMRCIKSHGEWSAQQPFEVSSHLDPNIATVAVTTRATIKVKHLRKFWRYVPTSSRPIHSETPGLLYTKGIGEVPVINMATFSVWADMDCVKAYAYGSKEHQTAIKMTRQHDWYSEELFARWQVFDVVGQWEGLRV